jgi:hypothetical protein
MTLSANPSTIQTGGSLTLTAVVNTQSNSAVPPSGTVQFLNGATPIGGTVTYVGTPYNTTTGAFASLQATLTTTLPIANGIITAQFGSDPNYASSSAAAPPDFSFTPNLAAFNISSPGQSGTTTLTVGPISGFTGTVNFTCAVPGTMREATCSLSPTSLPPGLTTVLTVNTTASHTAGGVIGPNGWMMLGGGTLLGCLLFLIIPARQRRLKLAFGLACVLLLTIGTFGCGGGSSGGGGGPTTDPGTAVGTYSVSVTATSGAISHTTNVSVTVQ